MFCKILVFEKFLKICRKALMLGCLFDSSGLCTLFFYKNQSILFETGCSYFFFFFHFWGWNVLNLFLFPLPMPQRRMSDWVQRKAHYFISFIFFLSSSAHRQPLGGVLQKDGSATVLKPIKQYLQRSSIFHYLFLIDFHTL